MRIEMSKQHTIITDPQRRVYNGCPYSSEQVFGNWETLESGLSEDLAKERLEFWIDLNDFAVSQRGEGSRTKYRIVDEQLELEK